MKTKTFEKNSYWIWIALTIVFLLMLIFTCRSQSNWAGVSVGATDMAKIYVGENLVWEKPSACTGLTIGGECYDTITIGTQTWLDRNLHYTDSGAGIYSYNDEADSSAIYGYLYTWDAAMRVDTAITGWHLPDTTEVKTLANYLGLVNGSVKMKETGYRHWLSPNTGATNSSGFTALGAGVYYSDDDVYEEILQKTIYWTSVFSSENLSFSSFNLTNTTEGIELNFNDLTSLKNDAISVRLIKD